MLGLQNQNRVWPGKLTEVVDLYKGRALFSPSRKQCISPPLTSLLNTVHVLSPYFLVPASSLHHRMKARLGIQKVYFKTKTVAIFES